MARQNIGYGLTNALQVLAPSPKRSQRAPKTTDKGYLPGQIWIKEAFGSEAGYILLSNVGNSANWVGIALASGAAFTTLSSTGATTLATAGTTVNTFGSTTGATSLSFYVGTGNYLVDGVGASTYTWGPSTTTGTITLGGSAGTGTMTFGSSTGAQSYVIAGGASGVKTVNVATGATANVVTINSTTGAATTLIQSGSGGIDLDAATGSGFVAIAANLAVANAIELDAGVGGITLNTAVGTAVVTSDAITSTLGDITATNGDVILAAATNKIQLPGPVFIMSGAGVPANGLAIQAGDMYIRTDPAGATSRIYIATGAGAWSNVTCAA